MFCCAIQCNRSDHSFFFGFRYIRFLSGNFLGEMYLEFSKINNKARVTYVMGECHMLVSDTHGSNEHVRFIEMLVCNRPPWNVYERFCWLVVHEGHAVLPVTLEIILRHHVGMHIMSCISL